eukprot:4103672-Lingulodinium_polyedra.AAC.1
MLKGGFPGGPDSCVTHARISLSPFKPAVLTRRPRPLQRAPGEPPFGPQAAARELEELPRRVGGR